MFFPSRRVVRSMSLGLDSFLITITSAVAWVFVLIVYSCLQGIILLLQDSRLGARFFLSASALAHLGIKDEETWEYHPVLPYSDIEGKGAGLEDCPICMEPIDRGDKEDRELGMQSKARWGYMVTPCHHVCHTECLEAWMQVSRVIVRSVQVILRLTIVGFTFRSRTFVPSAEDVCHRCKLV